MIEEKWFQKGACNESYSTRSLCKKWLTREKPLRGAQPRDGILVRREYGNVNNAPHHPRVNGIERSSAVDHEHCRHNSTPAASAHCVYHLFRSS